jgi:hypothetical protein
MSFQSAELADDVAPEQMLQNVCSSGRPFILMDVEVRVAIVINILFVTIIIIIVIIIIKHAFAGTIE